MARTIDSIKQEITDTWMKNDTLASAYGFAAGSNFLSVYSKVSVENTLCYIVAVAVWTLEKLFDSHKEDVDAMIADIIPGRAQWYAQKMLGFMKDKALNPDTDTYDTTGMDEAAIAAAKIVKHAVAVEEDTTSVLTVKVAGETDGVRAPLDAEEETQLRAYIDEIKYAGVRINLINATADRFNCEVDIYYNPQLLPADVEENCQTAIKNYIENLPFNGEYTNMALVDALQAIAGVKVVEFKSASSCEYGTNVTTTINARKQPAAGYFAVQNITLNMHPYE